MPPGQCALCLQNGELQDSHFVPKGLYKRVRDPRRCKPNPVVMTPAGTTQTSKQVTDYLLCKCCEGCFSRNGEKWVIENYWKSETEFPMRSALLSSTPIDATGQPFVGYSARVARLDVSQLAYFAAA